MDEIMDEDARIKAAVEEERKRCAEWARAMRRGDLDDIRSVIWAIEGGCVFDREEGDEG